LVGLLNVDNVVVVVVDAGFDDDDDLKIVVAVASEHLNVVDCT
jgi:hypothetical protein